MNTGMDAQNLKMTADAILGASEQDRLLYGQCVSRLRRERAMTQSELAEAANVGRRTIVNIESGASTPQAEKLLNIFEALDALVDDDEFGEIRPHVSIIAPLLRAVDAEYRNEAVAEIVSWLSEFIVRHPNHDGGVAG